MLENILCQGNWSSVTRATLSSFYEFPEIIRKSHKASDATVLLAKRMLKINKIIVAKSVF